MTGIKSPDRQSFDRRTSSSKGSFGPVRRSHERSKKQDQVLGFDAFLHKQLKDVQQSNIDYAQSLQMSALQQKQYQQQPQNEESAGDQIQAAEQHANTAHAVLQHWQSEQEEDIVRGVASPSPSTISRNNTFNIAWQGISKVQNMLTNLNPNKSPLQSTEEMVDETSVETDRGKSSEADELRRQHAVSSTHKSPKSKPDSKPGQDPVVGLMQMISANSVAQRWRLIASHKALPSLAPFVPELLKDDILASAPRYKSVAAAQIDMQQQQGGKVKAVTGAIQPCMDTFKGAVMIADVTGFTKLTELLSKRGSSGVELLTRCMNNFFSKVIDLVLSFGGDIIKFAGDSMIIAFYPLQEDTTLADEDVLKVTTLRCLQCASELCSTLGHVKMLPNGDVVPITDASDLTQEVEQNKYQRVQSMSVSKQRRMRRSLSRKLTSISDTNVAVNSRSFNDQFRASREFGNLSRNNSREFHDPNVHVQRMLTRMRTRMSNERRRAQNEDDLREKSATQAPDMSTWELQPDLISQKITEEHSYVSINSYILQKLQTMEQEYAPGQLEFDLQKLKRQQNHLRSFSGDLSKGNNSETDGEESYRPVGEACENSFDNQTINQTTLLPQQYQHRQQKQKFSLRMFNKQDSSARSNKYVRLDLSQGQGWGQGKKYPQSACMRNAVLYPVAEGVRVAQEYAEDIDSPVFARKKFGILRNVFNAISGSKQAVSVPHFGTGIGSDTSSKVSRRSRPSIMSVSSMMTGDTTSNAVLSLKVICGAGTVCVFHVGGSDEENEDIRWEFFIGDRPFTPKIDENNCRQPIAQISDIEEHAVAGSAVVSSEVVNIVGDAIKVHQVNDNGDGLLLCINAEFDKEQLPSRQTFMNKLQGKTHTIKNRAAAILRMHIIDCVRQRIEDGYVDFINEIRPCTCLFIGFPHLTQPLPKGQAKDEQIELQSVQQALVVVQQRMRLFGGAFVQFRCDEKGFLAICAFGLPGHTHEDDSKRGIQAALSVVACMKEQGGVACVGVTSGGLFCASVGSSSRAEYTVFGDAINLSARLMCKSKAGLGEVLCDKKTYLKAKQLARYTALEPLTVKGKEKKVEVFSVARKDAQFRKSTLTSTTTSLSLSAKVFVGRMDILEKVSEACHRLQDFNKGGIFVFEGDAGMGKSYLLEHIMLDLQSFSCVVFSSSCSLDNKSQFLYPWRKIFSSLFAYDKYKARQLGFPEGVTLLSQRFQNSLSGWKYSREQIASSMEIPETLLPYQDDHEDDIVEDYSDDDDQESNEQERKPKDSSNQEVEDAELNVEHSEHSLKILRTIRRKQQKSLQLERQPSTQRIVRVLRQIIADFVDVYGPLILLIDDMHLCDLTSWNLLLSIAEYVYDGTLIITTLRSNDGSLSAHTRKQAGKDLAYKEMRKHLEKLLQLSQCYHIELENFSLEDIRQMMLSILCGDNEQQQNFSEDDVVKVLQKSGGMPMMVEQIILYLKQQQSEVPESPMSQPNISSIIKQMDSVYNVIVSRVDRLRAPQQLTIKVASVLGMTIKMDILRVVYPYEISADNLIADLQALESHQLLKCDPSQFNVWMFTSVVSKDVVYDMIPTYQRRQFHARLAEELERLNLSGKQKFPLHLLAYHWQQSCQSNELVEWRRAIKAMNYWQDAAQVAKGKGAYVEAVRLFQKAADNGSLLTDGFKDGWFDPQIEGEAIPMIPILKRVGWERQMATLYLVLSQTRNPETGISSYVDKAVEKCFYALEMLNCPLPDSQLLRPSYCFCNFVFNRQVINSMQSSTSYQKELALVLEVLASAAIDCCDIPDKETLQYIISLCRYQNEFVRTPLSPFQTVQKRCVTALKRHDASQLRRWIDRQASEDTTGVASESDITSGSTLGFW